MTVAYTLKDRPDTTRLVVKGAPEAVVAMCGAKLDMNYQQVGFGGNAYDGQNYLSGTVVDQVILGPEQEPDAESRGLKAITVAYRDFDTATF